MDKKVDYKKELRGFAEFDCPDCHTDGVIKVEGQVDEYLPCWCAVKNLYDAWAKESEKEWPRFGTSYPW